MPSLFIANYYPPFQSVAFFLSKPKDGVLLDETVDRAYVEYLKAHLPQRELFFAPDLMTRESLRNFVSYTPFSRVIPCIGSPATDDLRTWGVSVLAPSAALAERYSRKTWAYKLFKELALPMHEHEIKEGKECVPTHGLIFKGDISLSGSNVFLNREVPPDGLAQGDYIVEREIDWVSSPGVQYFIDETGEEEVIICDQILAGKTKFRGVRYPPSEDLSAVRAQSKKICEALFLKKYRGFINIDFIIDKEKRTFAKEINPRTSFSSGCRDFCDVQFTLLKFRSTRHMNSATVYQVIERIGGIAYTPLNSFNCIDILLRGADTTPFIAEGFTPFVRI